MRLLRRRRSGRRRTCSEHSKDSDGEDDTNGQGTRHAYTPRKRFRGYVRAFDFPASHITLRSVTPGYMMPSRSSLVLLARHSDGVHHVFARAAPQMRLLRCRTVNDALTAVRSESVRVLVCSARDANGASTESLISLVAREYATVGMIGVLPRAPLDSDALIRLVRAGTHSVLVTDGAVTLLDARRVLMEALVRSGVSGSRMHLLAQIPASARPVLEYGLRYAQEPLRVASVARALNVNRKTLYWWCTEAGIMAPQRIFAWCRLLAAAALLEDVGRPVDHVALELDFPSGTALRNSVRRYMGVSASELRRVGATRAVIERFRMELRPGNR